MLVERVALDAVLFEFVLIGALLSGITGAINGAAFAVFLMVAERRRTLDALSKGRVALWGALGGAALPLATYILSRLWLGFHVAGVSFHFGGLARTLIIVLSSSALGAAVAVTHLSLARRVPAEPSRASLGSGGRS